MTLGCENGYFALPREDIRSDGPIGYIGSYVDIAFREPSVGTFYGMLHLAQRIVAERQPVAQQWTNYEFHIEQLVHFFGSAAHGLMLRIIAHGASEAMARKNFDAQCAEMAKVFDRLLAPGGALNRSTS